MSKHTFSSLGEDQKRDLMLYFYERNSKKTDVRLQPKYEFCLEEFRGYFGFDPKSIRRGVMRSEEYLAFHEERSRPPPPPEMSLLTRALIAACLLCPLPPAAGDDAGERIRERDRWEREHASEAQVVRKSDRKGKGILFSEGMPFGERKYVCGENKLRHKLVGPESRWDHNKSMVCNMQRTIEQAATSMVQASTYTKQEIFRTLVEDEEKKAKEKGDFDTTARAPYKARAALGLVLLLTSVLGYHLLMMVSVSSSVIVLTWHSFLTVSFQSSRIMRRRNKIGSALNRGCNSKEIPGKKCSNCG